MNKISTAFGVVIQTYSDIAAWPFVASETKVFPCARTTHLAIEIKVASSGCGNTYRVKSPTWRTYSPTC